MRGSESIRNFLAIAMSLRVESIYIVRRRRVKKKFVFFFQNFSLGQCAVTLDERSFYHPGRGKCISPWTKEVHITLDEWEKFAHVTRECPHRNLKHVYIFDFLPAGRACAPAPRAASIVFPSFPKRNTCGATLDQPAPQFQTGLQRSRPRKSAGPEACAKETSERPAHIARRLTMSLPLSTIHYVMAHPLLHQQAFWNVERSVCPVYPVWFLYVYRRMPSHVCTTTVFLT